MHIESSVTSVSWIPSEAATGVPKAGFTLGLMHYDDPPPDHIEDLGVLHRDERFRFANHLAAWIDVDDGQVVNSGYCGQGYITRVQECGSGRRSKLSFNPSSFRNSELHRR